MIASGMFVMASCSDFSDYNTVPVSSNEAAESTLWENISSNSNLSDFASVLTRVGYDEILDAAHTYTVWAPVNGSFSLDSLNQLSDDKVSKEFVQNLIADYSHQESDVSDSVICMLNEKLQKFTGKISGTLTFGSKEILPNETQPSVYNYPSVNGLLYTLSSPVEFRYNGYEYISEASSFASQLANHVARYEVRQLDEDASVKGEIIDGLQHYDDSVIVVSNTLIENTLNAKLSSEDSLYTVLIPTDEAWNSAYETISDYFNYIETINYQDLSSTAVGTTKGGTTPTSATGRATIMSASLGSTSVTLDSPPADAEIQDVATYWTDSITKNRMMRKLIYSENVKRYNSKLATDDKYINFAANDSLYTTTRNFITDFSLWNDAMDEVVNLSNGHARIVNNFPFVSEEFYAPTIYTRNLARCVTATGYSSEYVQIDKSELDPAVVQLEEGEDVLSYVKAVVPTGSTFAPELDFYLSDVLSTTYDIYAVVVPAFLDDTTVDHKPYTLRFDINYTDADNNQIAGRFDGEGIVSTSSEMTRVSAFVCGDEKVDTIKLGRITFPICYYGTEAQPNIKAYCTLSSFSSSNRARYEQQIRIANIIMVPVSDEEQNATKED